MVGWEGRNEKEEGNRGEMVSRLVGTVGPRPTRLIMFDIAKPSADSLAFPAARLIPADCIPSRLSAVPPSHDNATNRRFTPRQTESFTSEQGSSRVYLCRYREAAAPLIAGE